MAIRKPSGWVIAARIASSKVMAARITLWLGDGSEKKPSGWVRSLMKTLKLGDGS